MGAVEPQTKHNLNRRKKKEEGRKAVQGKREKGGTTAEKNGGWVGGDTWSWSVVRNTDLSA